MRSTINDVAKVSGVAISTVSMALRDSTRISELTRARVKAIAKELNFTPNGIAQALVYNKTHTIGVIVYHITIQFYNIILSGIQEVLYHKDYDTLTYSSSILYEPGIKTIQKLLKKGVDGLILLSGWTSIEEIQYLKERGIPFVVYSRNTPDNDISCVLNDNEKGGYKLTRHLMGLGHRNIAYIGYPLTNISHERFSGYKKALEEGGIRVTENMAYLGSLDTMLPEFISRIAAAKDRPTALVVFNDQMAIRAMNILAEKGIRVPEDMAVVGFDNIEVSGIYNPPLTTVDNFPRRIGEEIAEILIEKISGKDAGRERSLVIEPELIVRRSSGGVK